MRHRSLRSRFSARDPYTVFKRAQKKSLLRGVHGLYEQHKAVVQEAAFAQPVYGCSLPSMQMIPDVADKPRSVTPQFTVVLKLPDYMTNTANDSGIETFVSLVNAKGVPEAEAAARRDAMIAHNRAANDEHDYAVIYVAHGWHMDVRGCGF